MDKKTSGWMRFFVAFFFVGYIMFFTSKIWMGWMNIEGKLIEPTKLYETKLMNEREITIYRWDYCEQEKKMEIELEINNQAIDNQDEYDFSAKTRNRTSIKVVPMVSEKNYVVLQLHSVPKNFHEISLKMALSGKEPFTSFYTNQKSVNRVSEIKDLDATSYKIRHLEDIRLYCEDSIKKEELSIEEGDGELESFQETIDQLKREEEFQTEEQISVTEGKIAATNSEMDAIRKKQEESKRIIEELEKRISLGEKKRKVIQGEAE